jgi:hypothetical protein
MKIDVFVLADTVELYGGRLVIVGIFDKFIADGIPAFTRPIGLALKIQGEKKDYDKTYDAHLILRKTNSKKILIDLTIPIVFKKPVDEAGIYFVSAMYIGSLKLISWGKYVFELKVASKVIVGTSFFAVKSQTKATKKKANKPKKKSATNKAS